MMRSLRFVSFVVVLGFFASCGAIHCPQTKTQTKSSEPLTKKVYAIGDLHGDLAQTYRALTIAGAIDGNHRFVGKNIIVVQTGDQVDRGDEDKEVLDELDRLAKEAPAFGSQLIILNGNHELMNTQLDLRYTTKQSNMAFAKIGGTANGLVQFDETFYPETIADLLKSPHLEHFGLRARAFAPGQDYAVRLSNRPFYAIVNDSVFVHGGITLEHIEYGLEKLNSELRDFFLTGAEPSRVLTGNDGPFWLRAYSSPPDDPLPAQTCARAAQALKKLGVKRMVVGHTIQKQINSACNNTIWRIDIGMSKAYGNRPAQVLEIDGNNVRALDQPSQTQQSKTAPLTQSDSPATASDRRGLRS